MSIFFPYNINTVLNTFTSWFSIDLTNLSSFESLTITILANLYFFVFWFFILWCVLKSLNWVYERLF